MTYSYIKSVFPNYQITTGLQTMNALPAFAQNKAPFSVQGYDGMDLEGVVHKQKIANDFKELFENNNPPPPTPRLSAPQDIQRETHVVQVQETHESHLAHVMKCEICREALKKQLNIESDKARNEELMELFSYVLFGVFILMLMESIKNRGM
jgi:hypothetical protein